MNRFLAAALPLLIGSASCAAKADSADEIRSVGEALSSDLAVYTNTSLASGWESWSWSTTVSLSNTDAPLASGSSSHIKANISTDGGALSLAHAAGDLVAADYDSISFDVRAPRASSVSFGVETLAGASGNQVSIAASTSWTHQTVKLSSVQGSLTTFGKIDWAATANGQTIYVDNVKLVAKTTTGTTVSSSGSSLRGTNLLGMEGDYSFDAASGPVPDEEYAVHSTRIVDYLATKHVNVIRFLFSWERMQSTLNGPIPAATTGNYKAYFDDYKRIVDYATNVKGMTVIVEPWQASSTGDVGGPTWRGNLVGNGVVTSGHFADFWSKMAAVYESNPRVTIGLVTEPNNMSTMVWFSTAQKAVTAIRGAGFKGEIQVPGNGWTAGGSWNDSSYDTASTQRSNAYGWMNARGPGLPLSDPLGKLVAEIHSYADADASGSSASVVSSTVSRSRLTDVTSWARTNHVKVFIGEIGMYAAAVNARPDWKDFVSFLDANGDTVEGFAWWGCGKPGWWDDVAASGGGHFSITPTNNYLTDTLNMTMIAGSFTP